MKPARHQVKPATARRNRRFHELSPVKPLEPMSPMQPLKPLTPINPLKPATGREEDEDDLCESCGKNGLHTEEEIVSGKCTDCTRRCASCGVPIQFQSDSDYCERCRLEMPEFCFGD